jgi:hypothetical protein
VCLGGGTDAKAKGERVFAQSEAPGFRRRGLARKSPFLSGGLELPPRVDGKVPDARAQGCEKVIDTAEVFG